ncbi:MAG TPA: 3-phosphoshikimate 1-carboxyvinyltransferase, partial [Candidatus Binatia bacterium]|nr:3-phosphoshikimate 1-carboxyvinyltransferase [Candidatus Binatia bacterium]
MTTVTIKKTQKLSGQVCAPSSKSYTQRIVIAAALSDGTSKVSNPLLSE